MASFAAVDVEGKIFCRVVSGFNSDNLQQGMNIWFEKLAGAAAAESAMSMVAVVAFDYEDDGIEMHLTGKLELGCTAMGSQLLGAVTINKTDIFVAEMTAEGTTFQCDPSRSPMLDITAEVASAKIPKLYITMENLAFRVRIYHDDGAPANGTDYDDADANSTDAADALPDGRVSLGVLTVCVWCTRTHVTHSPHPSARPDTASPVHHSCQPSLLWLCP